jgi:hypothetical protein
VRVLSRPRNPAAASQACDKRALRAPPFLLQAIDAAHQPRNLGETHHFCCELERVGLAVAELVGVHTFVDKTGALLDMHASTCCLIMVLCVIRLTVFCVQPLLPFRQVV